jgi:hypothetical protein
MGRRPSSLRSGEDHRTEKKMAKASAQAIAESEASEKRNLPDCCTGTGDQFHSDKASVISGLAAASPIGVCRVGELCADGGTYPRSLTRPL